MILDNLGKQVFLGRSLAKGGEGEIYSINQNECAKRYFKPNIEKENKILSMIDSPPFDPTWATEQHRSIAWPTKALYENSSFIGFTMPLANSNMKESNVIFDPNERDRLFGRGYNFLYLLNTTKNIANVVSSIHSIGHCVGDLREKNILVSPETLITFVDCDSFQIKNNKNNKVYYCNVGFQEYLPPELLTINFKTSLTDRYYSDLFGLARDCPPIR